MLSIILIYSTEAEAKKVAENLALLHWEVSVGEGQIEVEVRRIEQLALLVSDLRSLDPK